MIYDAIERFGRYAALHPLFPMVGNVLAAGFIGRPPGKYELIGTGAAAILSRYDTRPVESAVIECHRRFIDVHLVLDGREAIGVGPASACRLAADYDGERDLQPLRGILDRLILRPGAFLLLYPEDAHQPGLQVGRPRPVVKCVLKIPVAATERPAAGREEKSA